MNIKYLNWASSDKPVNLLVYVHYDLFNQYIAMYRALKLAQKMNFWSRVTTDIEKSVQKQRSQIWSKKWKMKWWSQNWIEKVKRELRKSCHHYHSYLISITEWYYRQSS